MRPIVVAATSVAALGLALAMWLRRAPSADPQHAALARLIASLDALNDAYALGVDDNGALAVQILHPPPEPENESYEDMLVRWAWLRRFNDALGAEADWVDGYVVTFPAAAPVAHTPAAVLAAGLSSRPDRFATRAAARKWFPALANDGKLDLGGEKQDEDEADLTFHEAYEAHRHDFNLTVWRALHRAQVQAMLERLDRQQRLYELLVDSHGELVVCHLETREEQAQKAERGGDGDDDWDELRTRQIVDDLLGCLSPYISGYMAQSHGMYDARRVKWGVRGRGRYDPDDIYAAGLTVGPGSHPAPAEEFASM